MVKKKAIKKEDFGKDIKSEAGLVDPLKKLLEKQPVKKEKSNERRSTKT